MRGSSRLHPAPLAWRTLGNTILALASLASCSSSSGGGQPNESDAAAIDATGDSVSSGGDSSPVVEAAATEAGTDGGPADGQAGAPPACDGGVDAGDSPCVFSATVDGGLSSITARSANCVGLSAGATFQWVATAAGGDQVNLTFRIQPPSSFTAGQTGTFAAQLNIEEFDDSGSRTWNTPGADCTLVISTDVCAPTLVNDNRRLITGTGSCSQLAVSDGLPAEPSIGIGNFTFATTVQ